MSEASPKRPRRRTWRIVLAVLAASLLVEAIACAVFSLLRPTPPNEFLHFYRQHPYRAYAFVPGARSRDGRLSINSQGFRGPEFQTRKPPGVVRIACLGDEVTFGDAATTDSHTWPAQLERLLRAHCDKAASPPAGVEVINAGVPGYTSLESLIHFETWVLDYQPDLAIFNHAFNDAIFMACFEDFVSDYTHARRVFIIPKPRAWERSFALSFCLRRFGSISNPWGYGPVVSPNQLLLTDPSRLRVDDNEKRRCFRPERIGIFARNLRNFVFVARGERVTPVLSTVVCGPDAGFLAGVVGQINEAIRKTAAELSVPCVDLARDMPWSAGAFVDDANPRDGPKGLEQMARIFSVSLIQQGLVKSAPGDSAGDKP